jgi:hypothetical protein
MALRSLNALTHQRYICLEINNRIIPIPVPNDVCAYWREQFVRQRPTSAQRQRFTTLMNVLRAAYIKGREDGEKQP